MTRFPKILAGAALAALMATGAVAADLSIVHGSVGRDQEVLRGQLDKFEADTGNKVTIVSMPESTTDQFGQYKLWLAEGSGGNCTLESSALTHVGGTIDLRVDYLRPGVGEYFDLHANVMRLGSRVASTRMEFRGADGKLLSTGAGVYIMA